MQFLADYGLYLAQVATIVVAIIVVLGFIIMMATKNKGKQKGQLTIKKINDHFEKISDMINAEIQSKKEYKALLKQEKKQHKKNKNTKSAHRKPRIFVIRFNGDIKASAVSALREEVTAILLTAKTTDQILVCLESGGGLVNAYGLASSQLQRIKDAKIKLTIAVDKIAASGGYMMACVADTIIAAPFSVIGSIGVIAQLPNFHRLLDKNNIEFEQLTAGQYKRTLTMFGKNTKQGREKLQTEIEDTHGLFKDFIKQHRPQIDLNKVATGEHWFAVQAQPLNLVDKLQTSDDYLLAAKNDHELYEIAYKIKQPLSKRLSSSATNGLMRLLHNHSTTRGQDYL